MSEGPTDPYDPEVKARNRRLGLIVGGCAVGILAAILLRFIFYGLPEDPGTYQEQEQRRSATEPTGDEAEQP